MARKLNLKTGDVYGRLTLEILNVENTKQGFKGLWKCDCGNVKLYINSKVLSGHTNSCGCYRNDMRILKNTKHGHSKKHNESSEYVCWQKLKDRCLNENNPDYQHYGGRGISVCDTWLNSFSSFLADMGLKPTKQYSIDRINTNGNYCKENCKWSLQKDQIINRRNSIKVFYDSIEYCLKDACKASGLNYAKIRREFSIRKELPEKFKLKNNEIL